MTLSSLWYKINPFDIPNIIRATHSDIKEIKQVQKTRMDRFKELQDKLDIARAEKEKEHNLFLSVMDHLDDMVWCKDVDGRYIMVNSAFRDKFCYGFSWEEIKGRTDLELAKEFKELVGNTNHTFGEVCDNSDQIVIDTSEARQFLEHGMINGSMMKLVVNKSPVFNHKGVMFAVCGTGRDVTEWHNDLEKAVENCSSSLSREGIDLLKEQLNKYKFEEGDHVN